MREVKNNTKDAGVIDVRASFLAFFKERGHTINPSYPLVPDDESLLFTNAGMVAFKDIFTDVAPTPTPPRATSAQLCIRAGGKHNDLENVGYTRRHHTLFEMLGNFSFHDYFKKEAIDLAYEFVVGVLGLPKERLYVTVHKSDDEAFALWERYFRSEKIMRLGDSDNFWQMGDTGPCGPCSEIFYDQGEEHFHSSEDYFGGEGDRFLEIWNLVFMQFEQVDGKRVPLASPSIDTGMGLERIVAILEGKRSNFDSSIFMPIIDEISALTGIAYEYERHASFRVIADHIRAVVFLLASGVNFGALGRGYVGRRILRRAVRHGYLLGLDRPFMYKLVDVVERSMGAAYPMIVERSGFIKEAIRDEEERFFTTLASGISLFSKELVSMGLPPLGVGDSSKEAPSSPSAPFSGKVAFRLYDTYGFPLDLIEDMLKDYGMQVDIGAYNACMQQQKESSKAAWKGSGDVKSRLNFKELIAKHGANEFVGYEARSYESRVLALLNEGLKSVDTLEGARGYIAFDRTPLYGASGGQVGDRGAIYSLGDSEPIALVHDSIKAATDKSQGASEFYISEVEVSGALRVGQSVLVEADKSQDEIRAHHSATHLLHAALKAVLGSNANQAGSLVTKDYLRFDFTHQSPLSHHELERVEAYVNDLIARAIPATIREEDIEEAKAKGAICLFDAKYGQLVRTIDFGGLSYELCGGLHVENTARINSFYIVKEGGVSSGVRRIEAVAGPSAYKYARAHIARLEALQKSLKSSDIEASYKKLRARVKELEGALVNKKEDIEITMLKDGTSFVLARSEGALKELADRLKNENKNLLALLYSEANGKLSFIIASNGALRAKAYFDTLSALAAKKGIKLSGGGREDFVQGGAQGGLEGLSFEGLALEALKLSSI